MLLFYQISARVFLIHMFLYAGFYCTVIQASQIVFTWRHGGHVGVQKKSKGD